MAYSELMSFIRSGEVEHVRQALMNGQDPNIKDEDDMTPLMLAVWKEENTIMELLLEQKEIDINSVDNNGETALHYACFYANNPWAVKILGSDPRMKTLNTKDTDGLSPILRAIRAGNADCVRELVKIPGVDLFGHCPEGRTLLGTAVSLGYFDCVEELVQIPGIDLSGQIPYNGSTLLETAIRPAKCDFRDNDIVEFLLQQPELDINCFNKNGDTALHVACYVGNVWAVKKLVSDSRINLNVINKKGDNPLAIAIQEEEAECVRELVKLKGIEIPWYFLGMTQNREITNIVIHQLIAKDNSAFVQYCMDGKVEEVRQAIKDGQDPNVKAEAKYQHYSILTIAVIKNLNNIVELLLAEPKIDINWVDEHGNSALHVASYFGNSWAVAKLGNDPRSKTLNTKNKKGITPLMHAIRRGNVDCVDELVKLPGVYLNKNLEDINWEFMEVHISLPLEQLKWELVKLERGNLMLGLIHKARQNQCQYCEYQTDKKSNLDKHIKEIHDKSKQKLLQCDQCDYETVRKGDLFKHIKETHKTEEQKLLMCNQCDYTTVRQRNLNRHIRETHKKEDEPLLECDLCGYKAMRKYQIERHMNTHNNTEIVKSYQCDKCEFNHNKKQRLTQHIKRKHYSDNNIFECQECDFKTLLENDLKEHIISQHSKISKK